jgi:hypothetical protein
MTTSNVAFHGWGKLFGDDVIARPSLIGSAISEKFALAGPYRLKVNSATAPVTSPSQLNPCPLAAQRSRNLRRTPSLGAKGHKGTAPSDLRLEGALDLRAPWRANGNQAKAVPSPRPGAIAARVDKEATPRTRTCPCARNHRPAG